MKITIAIFIIGITLISCEGPKYFSITVVDKLTQQPIDSVFVQVKVKRGKKEQSAYSLEGYTDSLGRFIRSEMMGTGLSLSKFSFSMEYEKKGYVHKVETNKTEGIVELEH